MDHLLGSIVDLDHNRVPILRRPDRIHPNLLNAFGCRCLPNHPVTQIDNVQSRERIDPEEPFVLAKTAMREITDTDSA